MKSSNSECVWEKHKSFKTTLDRLCYTELCFSNFMSVVTAKDKERELSPASATAKKSLSTKIFHTKEETEEYSNFRCCACDATTSNPKWLKNFHQHNGYYPICHSCFESVASTQKKLSVEL